MSVIVLCACGKRLLAKPELAGRVVRCPACRERLRIPAARQSGIPPRSAQTAPAKSPGSGSRTGLLVGGVVAVALVGGALAVGYYGWFRELPSRTTNPALTSGPTAPAVKALPSITASPNPV